MRDKIKIEFPDYMHAPGLKKTRRALRRVVINGAAHHGANKAAKYLARKKTQLERHIAHLELQALSPHMRPRTNVGLGLPHGVTVSVLECIGHSLDAYHLALIDRDSTPMERPNARTVTPGHAGVRHLLSLGLGGSAGS